MQDLYYLGKLQAIKLNQLPVCVGILYAEYLKWYYANYIKIQQNDEFEQLIQEKDVNAINCQFIQSQLFVFKYEYNIKNRTDYIHLYRLWYKLITSKSTNITRRLNSKFWSNL